MTIHDDIDSYLAADLHNELSEQEERALHTHLIECAACRKVHQESKIMNKVLEEKFAREKPNSTFEQRMLAGFRNRIPQRTASTAKLIVNLMRLRSAQIAAVAVVLLALVQVGRLITGEGKALSRDREYVALGQPAAQPAQTSLPSVNEVGALSKSESRAKEADRLAAGKPFARGQVAAASAEHQVERENKKLDRAEAERGIATRSNIPTAEEAGPNLAESPDSALANRKLVRNAQVEIEIANFDEAVQKITAFTNEERGYVATTSSEKQANGKLKGEIVIKVLPENLDRFLQKIHGLGELKNQTLGTEDVTKAYFDTDARLKNARVMEQRLIDMLKTKTGKVSDLLQVEKELGRVREGIEKMQGELKYWDSQVQFATVTIALAEKDLEEPATFLVKERAQLALYAPDVEKVYNDIKGLASQKVQITNAQLDRDYSGRVSGRVGMLIAPEESDAVMGRVKGFGRVENFQDQTERIAQGGSPAAAGSENARTKHDKVELNVTISREEQEQAFQQTSLQIRTSSVDEKAKQLHALTEKQNGRVRGSSFSRDPNGREFANISLRVAMKNYPALMQSLNSLGQVENLSVQRQDRTGGQIDEANAPADISIKIYSQGNIVSSETGLIATLRHTLAQGVAALMWSLRMIGVALAFLAPWAIAIVAIVWIAKCIVRANQ